MFPSVNQAFFFFAGHGSPFTESPFPKTCLPVVSEANCLNRNFFLDRHFFKFNNVNHYSH